MCVSVDLVRTSSSPSRETGMNASRAIWPIMVCMLGTFRVLKTGRPISTRRGGRAELLLSAIGGQHPSGVERERLLDLLWPSCDVTSASNSLNSLVYALYQQFGDAIGGAHPVVLSEGRYYLNSEAGVGLDLAYFDALVARSAREERSGDHLAAMASAREAVQIYRGDLAVTGDVATLIQRERMRTLYLSTLARLADHAFACSDYVACLNYTTQLLTNDPCREDAHRLIMRCHLRRDERSQALRQYHLCATILRREFDAVPEPETTELYDNIRRDPARV